MKEMHICYVCYGSYLLWYIYIYILCFFFLNGFIFHGDVVLSRFGEVGRGCGWNQVKEMLKEEEENLEEIIRALLCHICCCSGFFFSWLNQNELILLLHILSLGYTTDRPCVTTCAHACVCVCARAVSCASQVQSSFVGKGNQRRKSLVWTESTRGYNTSDPDEARLCIITHFTASATVVQ